MSGYINEEIFEKFFQIIQELRWSNNISNPNQLINFFKDIRGKWSLSVQNVETSVIKAFLEHLVFLIERIQSSHVRDAILRKELESIGSGARKGSSTELVNGNKGNTTVSRSKSKIKDTSKFEDVGGKIGKQDILRLIELEIFSMLNLLESDKYIKLTLKENYNILPTILPFFKQDKKIEELQLILTVIQNYSEDNWDSCKSYIYQTFIKELHLFIIENANSKTISADLAEAILIVLINLANGAKLLSIRLDPHLTEVIHALREYIQNDFNNFQLLSVTFMLLIEPSLPLEGMQAGSLVGNSLLLLLQQYAERGMLELCIQKLELYPKFLEVCSNVMKPSFTETDPNRIASSADKILVNKNQKNVSKSSVPTNATFEQKPKRRKMTYSYDPIHLSTIQSKFIEFQEINLKLLLELLKFNPSKLAKSILLCVDKLLPDFIDSSNLNESFQIIVEMLEVFENHIQLNTFEHTLLLRLYLKVIKRAKTTLTENIFKKAVKFIKFHPTLMSDTSLEQNALTAEIISSMSKLQSLYAEAAEKMISDELKLLIIGLAEGNNNLERRKNDEMCCIIQILETMSHFVRNTTILNDLLDFVGNPFISSVIAKGIFSCNDKIVRNVVMINAATSFNADVLDDTVRSIVNACTHPNSNATHQVKVLGKEKPLNPDNENFQLQRKINVDEDGNVNHIGSQYMINLYEAKIKVYQTDISKLNQEIEVLKKCYEETKDVISSQANVISHLGQQNENLLYDVQALKMISSDIERKNVNFLAAKKKELEKKEEEVKNAVKRIKELETLDEQRTTELENMKTKDKEMMEAITSRDEKIKKTSKENRTIKTELENARKVIASLELSLNKKTEEAKQNYTLYENEKRTLDTIRGVVGY